MKTLILLILIIGNLYAYAEEKKVVKESIIDVSDKIKKNAGILIDMEEVEKKTPEQLTIIEKARYDLVDAQITYVIKLEYKKLEGQDEYSVTYNEIVDLVKEAGRILKNKDGLSREKVDEAILELDPKIAGRAVYLEKIQRAVDKQLESQGKRRVR